MTAPEVVPKPAHLDVVHDAVNIDVSQAMDLSASIWNDM